MAISMNPTQRILGILDINSKELSALLKRNHQTISYRKTGKLKTPVDDCVLISETFNISLEYLLTGKDGAADSIYEINYMLFNLLDKDNYHITPTKFAMISKEVYQLMRYKKDVDIKEELNYQLELLSK